MDVDLRGEFDLHGGRGELMLTLPYREFRLGQTSCYSVPEGIDDVFVPAALGSDKIGKLFTMYSYISSLFRLFSH